MNLLDLMIKVGVDDQATSKLGEIGGRAAGIVGGAAKVVAGGVAAAAAGVAAVTKASLDGYSAYEQAVGGVQKLYGNMGLSLEEYAASVGQTTDQARAKWQALGNAQATMLKQAQGAFATCGMSANAYMEQATSFSAALINSLGGDTERAAAQTQKAMVSMADNVNTFGTSMQDVQNAYQGFAKQNYTMLDNLKLGYGGTQSEMQRLIDDANEYAKSIGKAGELSIDSFSDIVDAIDLVQQKQQIAGTTSREAATTIEGSVDMMKAAWEDWLTSLADEDWDVSETTAALAESLEEVASNVLPRVSEIVTTVIESLPELVGTLAPQVASFFSELFSAALDTLWQSLPTDIQNMLQAAFEAVDGSGLSGSVKGLLDSAFSGATPDLSGITSALTDAFQSDAFSSTLGALSTALETAESFMTGLGQSAESYLSPALDMLSSAWADLMDAVQAAQPWLEAIAELLGAALGLAAAAAVAVVAALAETIAAVVDAVVAFADGLLDGINAAIGFAAGIGSALMALPGQVASWLSGAISAVVGWVADMASNAVSAGSQFISGIAGFMSGLAGNVSSWLSGAISTVVGWVSQFASNATSAASTFGSNLRSGLASIPGTLGNIGSNIIQGIVNGITGAAGKVKDAIGDAIGNAVDFAKHLLGIASPSKVFKKFGYYTMEGMRLGIEQSAGLPLGAAEKAMAAVAEAGSIQMDAPDVRSAAATASVIEWLDANLGDVIASRTPYTGMRDFDRLARKAVAYA